MCIFYEKYCSLYIKYLTCYKRNQNLSHIYQYASTPVTYKNLMTNFRYSTNISIRILLSPSHYHHCANLSEDIGFIKGLSDIFCRVCEEDLEYYLSYPLYNMWGCVFSVYQFPCDDWENIYTLSHYHHQIGSMDYYPLFRVTSWNNGLRCMSFWILIISFALKSAYEYH